MLFHEFLSRMMLKLVVGFSKGLIDASFSFSKFRTFTGSTFGS